MSVLSDISIKTNVANGNIIINPYDERNVQPSSYDLTLLAEEPVRLRPHNYYTGRAIDHTIDAFIDLIVTISNSKSDMSDVSTFDDLADKLELIRSQNKPHSSFQLLSTAEYVQIPSHMQAEVHGRSSLARKGLFVHVSAGFIDPGFHGQITLECINVAGEEILLLPGDRVAQIVFTELDQPSNNPYDGRYQNQVGATASKFQHGLN